MSEYQYYEFQAIDRALTRAQQGRLANYSTRAEITSTRFVNYYEWGDFRGDVDSWIAKYFDAFVYVANWGTRDLRFRFPREVLDAKVAKTYCAGSGMTIRNARKHVVLAFWSEDESGDRWDDDRRGWMPSLIPLRADVAAGDHQALWGGSAARVTASSTTTRSSPRCRRDSPRSAPRSNPWWSSLASTRTWSPAPPAPVRGARRSRARRSSGG